ncbi:DNA repair protein RecO, partial [Candidatus Daviesbacteria bacterium RIFCSPLOWO2_02_FULL_36_8]
MRGFKTEGIILKRRNFGEADRILTVFTLQKGKISVIAKGVRRITSRRAGNVELLNRVIMFLYQGQGMPILTEAEGIESFENLKSDLVLSTVAFHIIELVDKLTAENQENRVLYEHLVNVLKRLEINPRQIFIRAFEVKILSNLGFATFQGQKILEDLEYSSWDEIEKMKIDKKQALELESILRYHLERVIEGSLK